MLALDYSDIYKLWRSHKTHIGKEGRTTSFLYGHALAAVGENE